MDIELYSTGLEDLSPPGAFRSDGIHVSTLTHRLTVKLGHYTPANDGLSDRNRELGQAVEHALCARANRKHPGEYLHNPELECDGLYGTPDLVWTTEQAEHSIKLTWMKPDTDPYSIKFWHYHVQQMCYLYMLRRALDDTAKIRMNGDVEWRSWRSAFGASSRRNPTSYLTGYLSVCFVNDWRPPSEQIPTWKIRYTLDDLVMNWAMIESEAALLRAETVAASASGIHTCCGCSCHICANGHSAGIHTDECIDRLLDENAG